MNGLRSEFLHPSGSSWVRIVPDPTAADRLMAFCELGLEQRIKDD
jgi:hypothetical protein